MKSEWHVRMPNVALIQQTRQLAAFNRSRLSPEIESADEDALIREVERRAWQTMEFEFIRTELEGIRDQALMAPTDAPNFVRWFEDLEQQGPGQHDPLFDWLETSAPESAMAWFLVQEVAGEAGFEDLVALTQVKLPTRVKLELARNYWDEMGQGHASGMHGPMLGRLADELALNPEVRGVEVVWESQALSNLMLGLAMHRRHVYRSIGALGVIELTAPDRASKISRGMKRLGWSGDARRYYALHSTLDRKHSESWNREVIAPLVAADARIATLIAEGALARLNAGARCFARYRSEFGIDGQFAAA
jgi:Iron-containing redox enzyme